MQKGVINVIRGFCAEGTKAAVVGEGKYVTLNMSSSSVRMNGSARWAASHLGAC